MADRRRDDCGRFTTAEKAAAETAKHVRIIETEDKVCGRCPSQGYSVLQFIKTED